MIRHQIIQILLVCLLSISFLAQHTNCIRLAVLATECQTKQPFSTDNTSSDWLTDSSHGDDIATVIAPFLHTPQPAIQTTRRLSVPDTASPVMFPCWQPPEIRS